MKAVDQLDNAQLNNAIKALNGMVDTADNKIFEKAIRFIGVNKETRVKTFVEAYEATANRADAENLIFPDEAVEFYTLLFADELEGGEEESGEEATNAGGEAVEEEKKEEEKKETPKKTPPKKTEGKSKTPPAPKKSEVKELVAKLIGEGKWTRGQVLDKTCEKHPDKARSTVRTYITDSLSEKYSEQYFGPGKRAQIDDKGIMSWA